MAPLTLPELPEALRRWVPASARLGFPEEQGWTSTVAFVEPGDVVFKRCTDPRYRDWLRREREVLDALAGTEVSVPRVLDFHDADNEVWLVMARLAGDSCSHAIHRADPAGRSKLYAAAGEAIRGLHAQPIPAALRSPEPFLERKLAAAEHNLAWCDGTPEGLAELRARMPDSVPERLVHADLNLDNLLVHEGVVTGFIDWAGGTAGDSRIDVALALDFGDEDEPDQACMDAFFEGYGDRPDSGALRWFRGLYEFY